MWVALEPFKNGGPNPINFRGQYESLCLVNSGNTDITFELSPFFIFTLAPGEVFDEAVMPFNSIKFTGTGTYKGFVRDRID